MLPTFRPILIATALVSWASAQEPAPAVPPQPVLPVPVPVPNNEDPKVQVPQGANRVPVADANQNKANAKNQIAINLAKVTGNEIAEFYHKLTGKRVLVESAAAPIEASIVVHGQGKSPEDAIQAFEKALLLNNLAIVPTGENEVKLIVVGGARNIRLEGIPVVGAKADIPDDDSVITYVMPLQYIKPEEASRTFTQSFTTLHNYGNITPVPNAAALIVTENASVVKKMIQLLERIDQPSAQIANRWIPCKYADVESLAETLDKIVNQQNEVKTTAAKTRQPVTPQNVPQVPSNSEAGSSAGENAPVQIVPDPRTNRLLIVGRPIDLVFLESLIAGFDIPTDNRNSLRRKLKYLSVVDFMPVAQQALERILGPDAKANDAQANNRNNNNNRNTNNQNNSTNRNNNGSNSSTSSDVLSAPDETGVPESLIVGRTLIVADTITNSIVVQGPPQSIEAVNKLLDEIDIRGPQVMISTVFGQFRREEGKDVGFDWLSTYQKEGNLGWAGQVNKPGIGENAGIGDLSDISKFPSLAGLAMYGTFGKHMNLLLTAAQNTGKFSVLSRPTVYTVNNAKAVISSGQRIAVPTSTLSDYTGGTSNQLAQNTNIEYKDVVLKLEVIPLVNSDKEVTLKVAQLNDQVVGSQTIGNLTVPTLSTQELITQVTVPNGGTIILGGLITRDVSDEERGVPILSDIPLLGWAFTSTTKKVEEREIVIFIQPTIINQDEDALSAQIRERSRYAVTPDVIKFGDPEAKMLEEPLPSDLEKMLKNEPQPKQKAKSSSSKSNSNSKNSSNPMNNMKRAGSPF